MNNNFACARVKQAVPRSGLMNTGNLLFGQYRWVVTLVASCVLMYGIFLGLFSLSGFPMSMARGRRLPFLADRPTGEDGFYALTVAWNIGTNRGLTYNGKL